MHTSQYNTLHVTSRRTSLHYTTSQTKHHASQQIWEHQSISQISTSWHSILHHISPVHNIMHISQYNTLPVTSQWTSVHNTTSQIKTPCITAHSRTSTHITDKHSITQHTTSHLTSTQYYAQSTVQHHQCDISVNLSTLYHIVDKTPCITAHIIISKNIVDKHSQHSTAHHTTSYLTSTQNIHITIQHHQCDISANLSTQYHIADKNTVHHSTYYNIKAYRR